MALDGKVSVNDDALARHPRLVSLIAKLGGKLPEQQEILPVVVEPDGHIGIVCNGAGLTMATMDLVRQAGAKTMSFLNLNGETRSDSSPAMLKRRLAEGLELMAQHKQVRVILINLISNLVPCNEIAEVILDYQQRKSPKSVGNGRHSATSESNSEPSLVIRLIGSQSDRARAYLKSAQLSLVDSLDEAVTAAVALAGVRQIEI